MHKRTKAVPVIALTGLLAACQPTQTDATSFKSIDECLNFALNDPNLTEKNCKDGWAEAQKAFEENAPRYETLAVCEEVHGKEACQQPQTANADSGGFFTPFFMGYMMSSLMDGGSRTVYAQPFYRQGNGYATPTGTSWSGSAYGTNKVSTSSLKAKPAYNKTMKPMNKTQATKYSAPKSTGTRSGSKTSFSGGGRSGG